jgi:serine/threonine-protein kinase
MMKPTGAADFGIAQNGSLVYVAGDGQALGVERMLVWVDRQGKEESLQAPMRGYTYPRLSPDGLRLALDIRQPEDIWMWEFARRTLTRLTFDSGVNRGVTWSPDGRRVAFSAVGPDGENVSWQAADGTGSAERLTQGKTVATLYLARRQATSI